MVRFRRSGAAAAAIFFTVSGAAAQDAARQAPPQIVTSGRGEVRVAPDRANLSVGVETRALTATEATTENGRRQRAVIDAVRAKGVPADQIRTSGFSLRPETQYDPQGKTPPKTTGYLVSNVVTVELRRIDLVGSIIDAALAVGATQVNAVAFSVANADSARQAALVVAVARAKGDAEVVARAAGGTLGPLIELVSLEFQNAMPRITDAADFTRGMAAAVTPIEAGLETIRASVTGRWQFVQPTSR